MATDGSLGEWGDHPDRGGNSAGIADYAPNTLGNFEFDVTLSYRRLERPRRANSDG